MAGVEPLPVVLPLWDRTMPSVVMALDRALRAFGGGPTHALTNNENTARVLKHAEAEGEVFDWWQAGAPDRRQ